MDKRIITDISNFIFVSDKPEAADAIFCPAALILNSPNMRSSCTIRAMQSGLFLRVESA